MADIIEIRRSYWRDAAVAGGIIGLLLFLVAVVNVNVEAKSVKTMLSLVNFLILGYFIYYFARKRSLKYGSEGFTYGQSMSYILAMMIFTGFIMGIGNYLLINFIAPEAYEQIFEEALEANPFYDPDTMDGLITTIRRNVFINLFSGIFSYVLYGGILGLIASAFIKRKPDIFAENNDSVNE